MIVFADTKFGLVQIRGSDVKRWAVRNPPSGLSEFLKSQSGRVKLTQHFAIC